jgi:hypothetical protein
MAVKYPLEHLIDRCITHLNNGMDLEAVLEEVSDDADELRPILAAVAWVRLEIPAPAVTRRQEGKQAIMEAAARCRRVMESTQGLLNEIRAGVPVQELLARATPEQRPVVLAAWRMHSTPSPVPNAARVALGRERLMVLVERRRALRQQALVARMSPASHLRAGLMGFWHGLRAPRPRVVRRALSNAMTLAAFVAALGMGVGRMSTAAADSLPGDPIYSIKRLGESARIFFAFDADRRVELNGRYAGARLREMLALSADGRDIPAEVLRDWVETQDNAYASIRRLPVGEQQRLLTGLIAAFGGAKDLERALGPVDGTRLASMVAWIESSRAAQADAAPKADATTEIGSLPQVPLPVQRPIAAEDDLSAQEPVAGATTLAPTAKAPEAQWVPEPDFFQPSLIIGDDDADDDTELAGTRNPGVADQPTVEPTDDTQIVQPPMELPTPGEDPLEDPGTPAVEEPVIPKP